MLFVPTPIRLELRAGLQDNMLDILTNETPVAWRATDLRFELAITDVDGAPLDLTPLSTLTLEVRESVTGTVLLSQTLGSGGFTATITKANWLAGTAQHAVFEFAHTATAFDFGTATTAEYHLVVKATTTDTPGKVAVCGVTTLHVEEAGVEAGNSPTPGDPTYYTAAESDARFTQVVAAVSPLAISGSALAPIIRIAPGTVQGQVLIWDATEEEWTTGSPNGECYVTNTDTGKHHRVTCDSSGGTLHLVLSPTPID